MKTKTTLFALVASILSATGQEAQTQRLPEISELAAHVAGRDARLGWWREARFGMFVHWGVSSVLGGSWNGRDYKSYAEHIQRAAKIPVPVYRKEVAGVFNPTLFDADAWVRLAKETGMGYFIITAKHHDGVAMYDSKVSDYDVMDATPWRRDPMKELQAACRKHGIKFGFYYSHAFDWGEENGAGNDWDWQNPGGDKLLHGSDWWLNYPDFLPKARKYVDEKAIPQILELIRNYQPDILWFDTPHKLPPEENLRIFAAVRKADPNIVINGRIFADVDTELLKLTDYVNTGDKPGEFAPKDGDWEGVPTTNESFGYNSKDKSHKKPGLLSAPGQGIAMKRLNEFDVVLTGLPADPPDPDNSVIALECEAPPITDDARLVLPAIGRNTLSVLDGKLEGSAAYRVGRGIGDAWSVNWIDATAAENWAIRLTEKAVFDVSVIYDASAPTTTNRLVEGDAGKELAKANTGAGGSYLVTIGENRISKTVRMGRGVSEPLGRITLEPGRYVFRIGAMDVTAAELFRLRRIVLDPVKP
jgi:hypothetical protein